jgi:hypothetical protein
LLVEYKDLFNSGDLAKMAMLPRKELLPRDEGLINIQAAEMVRGWRMQCGCKICDVTGACVAMMAAAAADRCSSTYRPRKW